MSELISGKEAKLAWAEGVTVQVAIGPDKFRTLVSSDDLGIFDRGNYFRIKPPITIINGIEVPAPFKPNVGEKVWVLSDMHNDGYMCLKHKDAFSYAFGAWRTENEIKQVVAALRSVLSINTMEGRINVED